MMVSVNFSCKPNICSLKFLVSPSIWLELDLDILSIAEIEKNMLLPAKPSNEAGLKLVLPNTDTCPIKK